MARLRASWRTSLPVVQQPRNPQSESIARSPYDRRDYEENISSEGRQAGLTGVTEIALCADREHEVADLNLITVAQRHGRELLRLDMKHREVGFGIASDQFGLETPLVAGRDLDQVCAFHDMSVGEHIPVLGIDDHAGSSRAHLTAGCALGIVELFTGSRVL